MKSNVWLRLVSFNSGDFYFQNIFKSEIILKDNYPVTKKRKNKGEISNFKCFEAFYPHLCYISMESPHSSSSQYSRLWSSIWK